MDKQYTDSAVDSTPCFTVHAREVQENGAKDLELACDDFLRPGGHQSSHEEDVHGLDFFTLHHQLAYTDASHRA